MAHDTQQRQTIELPDGYNGHTVTYYAEPLNGSERSIVWLRCAVPGKEYMKRWAHRETWLAALAASRKAS